MEASCPSGIAAPSAKEIDPVYFRMASQAPQNGFIRLISELKRSGSDDTWQDQAAAIHTNPKRQQAVLVAVSLTNHGAGRSAARGVKIACLATPVALR